MSEPKLTPPPSTRRRRFGWPIALAVLAVLLVVGFFVADAYARQYATGYLRDRIVAELKLDPKTPVEVDLGTGSIILQALGGSIDRVTVRLDRVSVGDLSGAVVVTASRVPLDSSKPVGTLGIVVTVSQDDVRKLGKFMSALNLSSIDLGKGVIRVGTQFATFFMTIPVTVELVPSAVNGSIAFEPRTITLGTTVLSVAELRARPEFAALAGELLKARSFCVASYLPQALKVQGVQVIDTNLVLTINGDGTALSGPALSPPGVCPAAGK